MTCVTRKTGNRHTTRHQQRETPALESARQNRYTDPLHTASAERRHSFALKWFSILSVVWDHRLEGFSETEKRDLRDQFGDIWYQLATLLGHADPATTRTYYLEPFTGLDVDYLMSVLDDGERTAIDALVRAAGMTGSRTLAAITPPGAQAIACYLDEGGDTR